MTVRGLVWSFAAVIALGLGTPQAAQAQTRSEVAAARNLFQAAVTDEQAKRFDVALEKFRRVQGVKDTTNVRYRIAACLEALGKLRESLAAYEAAVQLGETEAKSGDAVRAAKDRIVELKKRMPALTITLSEKAPSDAEVELDHDKVSASALGAPILLDPGVHEVSGSAADTPPFHTSLTLAEGARVSLVVPLERPPPVVKPPDVVPPIERASLPVRDPPPASDGSGRRTWGFIGLGTGGVLLVGSGVVLLLRHNDIATLNDACNNGGVCPTSRETELRSVRSRALVEGPVAGVLAAGGVVAVSLGVYLLLSANDPKPPSARSKPVVNGFATPSAAGIDLTGRF